MKNGGLFNCFMVKLLGDTECFLVFLVSQWLFLNYKYKMKNSSILL